MLTFLMNAGNFGTYLGGGRCDGTRLIPGGVELDLQEHAADADTLGLWHLHDKVWTDSSGNGHTLTPHEGATLDDYGAALQRASGQYAQATGLNLRGYGAATLEAWFELASLPQPGQPLGIIAQHENLRLYLSSTAGNYFLLARAVEDQEGTRVQTASYQFPAPPELGSWRHVAVTWERGVALRLWLDGSQVAADTTLSGGDFYYSADDFFVGCTASGACFDGHIDEVRLSRAVRYTTTFQPKRYVATGTFTSPSFDGLRLACAWLALQWQAATPPTTQLAMEDRTGDELSGGDVVGSWRPALGTPPAGRYLQWRAALTRSTDARGLSSPLLEAVTAVASEAGYNVYHGAGEQAAAIDYEAPLACLGPARLAYDTAALAYPAVHWFGIRSANASGTESKTVDAEARLELDAAGRRVLPRPASVESLEAAGAGGGRVQLQWLALPEMGEARPDAFRIYGDGGTGQINFTTPLGQVACLLDRWQYDWTSDPYEDGLRVRFAVRAETLAGGQDAQPPEVELVIDSSAPLPPGFVEAAPSLSD